MKFKQTKLAAALSAATLATTMSAPAGAAVSLGGEDGWEVKFGGFINLFYNHLNSDGYNGAGGQDSAHLNEGLLPNFHTMTVTSPEVNGLTGTGQITFAVDSSANKGGRLNKAGVAGTPGLIDLREVFFNVSGSFGTVSAGRTLSLFQRQAILKDMTLFGVGASNGLDNAGTSLGRIGHGYVYPDFRTRFTYKTNDISGFNVEFGLFDPQEPIGSPGRTGGNFETDLPQFQVEATYSNSFGGGDMTLWVGALWQEMSRVGENISGPGATAIAPTRDAAGMVNNTPAGFTYNPAGNNFTNAAGTVATVPWPSGGDVTSSGIDFGGEINMAGFGLTGHYYTGKALGDTLFLVNAHSCNATGCEEADNDGYYFQGTYTWNGKTKFGAAYGGSFQDADAANGITASSQTVWTIGVYHDVTSWLKVIAEYNDQSTDGVAGQYDLTGFSVGGFLLW